MKRIGKFLGEVLLYMLAPIILTLIYWLITRDPALETLGVILLSGVISETFLTMHRFTWKSSGTITITETSDKTRWDFQLTKEPDDIAKKDYVIIFINDERGATK